MNKFLMIFLKRKLYVYSILPSYFDLSLNFSLIILYFTDAFLSIDLTLSLSMNFSFKSSPDLSKDLMLDLSPIFTKSMLLLRDNTLVDAKDELPATLLLLQSYEVAKEEFE
jgi:hypothetical protein